MRRTIIHKLSIIATVLFLPSLVLSQETYQFERMWPTLIQPWYFIELSDISIDSMNFVYIADNRSGQIRKFTSDGQFVTKWGGNCWFLEEEGCVDPDGNGPLELGDGQFCGPYGTAEDSSGFVYVADAGNNRIQKFTSDGQFVTKWGGRGSGEGEFYVPQGIAVDSSGFVYVADTYNYRIQKFTSNGEFVTTWGSNCWVRGGECVDPDGAGPLEPGDGQFDEPRDIAVDSNDFVYVADYGNDRIQKFTKDGEFISKWIIADTGFPHPGAIVVDRSGFVYVADTRYRCIRKFTSDGGFVTKWGDYGSGDGEFGLNSDPTEINGVAVDSSGFIYVADTANRRIQKFNSDGEFVTKWKSNGSGNGEFHLPGSTALDSNGYVYVNDGRNHRIQKFTSDGEFVTKWGDYGSGDGEFSSSYNSVAVDNLGFVYVADAGNNRIQKFTSDGQFVTKWECYGTGITADSSGFVYVADYFSNRIQKFTSDGTFVSTWGSEGTDDGQFFDLMDIAVDNSGFVYVVDMYFPRIQKFTSDGEFVTKWFCESSVYNERSGIAVDSSGFVYVTQFSTIRPFPNYINKFTSDGEFVAKWGSDGTGPGQMSAIWDVAVGPDDRIYITEVDNNRIQVFRKVESVENSRAIIVAGGGSYPGNNLWDATQMCTSFAYRALTYQGFTIDDINYLSEDTDLDLDGDGESNVEAAPTNLSLNTAITEAALAYAENLVVYLTNHGGTNEEGDGILRLNVHPEDSETLTASDLASMLNIFPGRIIVIVDACQSGSFMTALEGDNRIIITSTQADEQAKFINQGTISFSNFFWTGVFNGSSIEDSYNTARGAVNVLAGQNPDISYPPDINPGSVHIGNGVTGMTGEAPEIGNITTSPVELHLETLATIRADNVIDPDGIARVWAIIWPPHFDPGSVDNPLTELPSVDLLPVTGDEGNYEVAYNGFIAGGIYQITVYAMDTKGIVSQPKFMTISRNLTRKAVIVAGGAGEELSRAMIEKNTALAYNALLDQFYYPEDIYFMMSNTGIEGVDGAPSVFYLNLYLEDLANDAGIENLDLTIYLIGAGDAGTFIMNDDVNMNDDDKILKASQIDAWLDEIKRNKQALITLIYDGNKSGSFIPAPETIPPDTANRIIITSTGPESTAYFKTEGNVSFSSFFWDRIAAGATIGDAFIYAKSAISYCTRENDISFSCYRPQHPLMDANSNGIANELNDYEIATVLYLGDGVAYADDPPLIGSVSVAREGDWLTITAQGVSSTNPVTKVWAVIRPIGYCPGFSEGVPQGTYEPELGFVGDGTYEGSFAVDYACKVTVYAMSLDTEGAPNISAPLEPIINQPGGDIYEDPDGDGIFDDDSSEANVIVVNHPSPQPHTLYHPEGVDDTDWVKFYAVPTEGGHTYTVEAGNLVGTYPVIELYKEDDLTEPLAVLIEYPAADKVWFDFPCTYDGLFQEGIYYVKVVRGASGEGEMSYDLQVYDANQELTATVAGRVEDAITGDPIDGAVITIVGGTGWGLSTRGEYMISEVPGSWTMTAREDRHIEKSYMIRINTNDQYISQDIDMQPRVTGACRTAADCDDGRFCNGTETCLNRTCQPGTPPCADDGIFCNGIESCNEEQDVCEHAGNPCSQELICDEERDVCSNCIEDAQCDDGKFCNGIETCVNGDCQDGTSPCPDGVECDEDADECLMPSISILPRTIMQSRWMPIPLFMSIRGTNTHFSGVSKVTFSPPSIMNVPFVINEQTLFCMCLIMPAWITGPLGDSIEVTVKTNLEVVAQELDLRSLPLMMGEEKR